jgi:hypothetical protein
MRELRKTFRAQGAAAGRRHKKGRSEVLRTAQCLASLRRSSDYFLHLPLGKVTQGFGVAVNSEFSNKFGEPVPGLLK